MVSSSRSSNTRGQSAAGSSSSSSGPSFSSTISKDKTKGEGFRNAQLLAEFGRKSRSKPQLHTLSEGGPIEVQFMESMTEDLGHLVFDTGGFAFIDGEIISGCKVVLARGSGFVTPKLTGTRASITAARRTINQRLDDNKYGATKAAGPGSARPISNNAQRVLEVLKQASLLEGYNIRDVSKRLSMSMVDVATAADDLKDNGLIYDTVDDETWAVLN